MDAESKKLLEQTLELAKENNSILHSMRRGMRFASIARVFYWVFIIGSAVGAYYLVGPYVDQLKDMYSGAGEVLNNLRGIGQ